MTALAATSLSALGMPAIDPQPIERMQGAGLEFAPRLAQRALGGPAHSVSVSAQRGEEFVQRSLYGLIAHMLEHEAYQRGQVQAALAREVAGLDAVGVSESG